MGAVALSIPGGEDMELGPVDFWDFTALQWRLRGVALTVIIVYLTPSEGAAKSNLAKLANLGSFIRSLRTPWLALGDWNMTPGELDASGWPQEVEASFLVPSDTEFTSWSGPGRLLDFGLLGGGARGLIRGITSDDSGPWTAHKAIIVDICPAPEWSEALVVSIPRPFLHPPPAACEGGCLRPCPAAHDAAGRGPGYHLKGGATGP